MLILEYKRIVSDLQTTAIREAIKVVQFIRNKALRLWMDTNAKPYDLNRYCAVLAKEYPFAEALNSQARQAASERAAYAISRYLKPDKAGSVCANPNSRRTTAPWSTKPPDGNSLLTANASPSPMVLVSAR